jgi:hypothetical protein
MSDFTTFTELLREAKDELKVKIKERPINLDLQKTIDSLNKMFNENWTPLFDKNKEYELWDKYSSHIYFGKDYKYVLLAGKTPINKVELLPVNWLFIKKFPYSTKILYVIVLRDLVQQKLSAKFSEAISISGLAEIFDDVQDLDYLIKSMNNVLGENTLIEEDNSIKFKNERISVPNLQLMKDCYNVKNEELFDAITSKHYEEINLDLFNMLNTHEKIYPALIELLNKLKTLYLDEVHTYYKEECIKYAEAEFEILCKDYSINSNDYVLCPVIFKNKLTWDIRSKNKLKLPTFYLLNHWSTHKAMKSISESAFRESLGSMVKPIEDEALRLECNSTVDKIVNESLKPIKKLNLSMRDLDNEIDFNGCKISVKTKDGKLTLKYKDYTFHVPYYSPNSVHTYFEKENGIEDNKTWVKTKEDIQTVADLFIEFLNS